MDNDWLISSISALWWVPLSSVAMLLAVIGIVRIMGLRSFSKMSSFDFAVTVSIGSILGSVATSSTPVVNGAAATTTLLGTQAIVAFVRARRRQFEDIVDNTPILLMDGSELLDENLRLARVTKSDVMAKLRAANVASLDRVQAVVLETTGDISVIHGDAAIDPSIVEGVRRGPSYA